MQGNGVGKSKKTGVPMQTLRASQYHPCPTGPEDHSKNCGKEKNIKRGKKKGEGGKRRIERGCFGVQQLESGGCDIASPQGPRRVRRSGRERQYGEKWVRDAVANLVSDSLLGRLQKNNERTSISFVRTNSR